MEGVRDAVYFDAESRSNGVKYDIHWMFVLQRSLFAILIFLFTNIFILLFFILAFSFFHNGWYFYTRNKLNDKIYPNKFIDSSTTSSAIFEFNFEERVLFFIFGIIFLILNFVK